MIVKSLELSNFRNYEILSIDFSKDTNILYGDNAQGKTNILEAIYTCATTKSHRGSKDREMIRLGQEEAHIRIQLERRGIGHRVDMHIKKNKPKGVAIDGIPIRKSSELFGLIHVVSFSPEDLGIIKNGPSERRRFLDMVLCQMDKVYLHQLISYNKVVNQRNSLLKQIGYNRELMDTLQIWDAQMVAYGQKIIRCRKQFLSELSEIVHPLHHRLSGNREELQIAYEPNVSEEEFPSLLAAALERDQKVKMTTVGPHRDDISFYVSGADIRKYGSQGQQRTSALSLKLSELNLVRKRIQEEPILLLDDVLSELDRHRQTQLLESISGIQTIVTCTGLEEFIRNRVILDKIYHVAGGKVMETSFMKEEGKRQEDRYE